MVMILRLLQGERVSPSEQLASSNSDSKLRLVETEGAKESEEFKEKR